MDIPSWLVLLQVSPIPDFDDAEEVEAAMADIMEWLRDLNYTVELIALNAASVEVIGMGDLDGLPEVPDFPLEST